jgi:hypothetical protein
MEIAGIHVRDAGALRLAIELRKSGYVDTAELLEGGVVSYQPIVGLSARDREAVLAVLGVLVDPPDELARLRSALLPENVGGELSGRG